MLAGAALAELVSGVGLLPERSAVVLAPVMAAAAAYAAAHALLAGRIELARNTLRQIRKHRFDNLEALRLPRGDEMNALIWQVYRTGRTLEKEIQELKKMESYRREFLGDVSHELKTPIFTVQGFAETLLGGALDDARVSRKFVERILNNTLRLNNLVRDLSEISRIESGALRMAPVAFGLGGVVADVLEALELTAQRRGVTLAARIPEDLPPVLADKERIRQVLVNLVENGVKYNNPGGRVLVEALPLRAGEALVRVEDDGIGIAPEHIARLTERFYRVDKSRSREQGGTGLGLAIIKHILAAHDRRLIIESAAGQGSAFSFTLPTA